MLDEARRCVEELGLTGFVLADRPETRGVPGFLDAYWAPFFELCNDQGIPINFHIGTNIDGFEFTWQQLASRHSSPSRLRSSRWATPPRWRTSS